MCYQMFNAKDYNDLTPNSRRSIAKLSDFTCPFYTDDIISVPYVAGDAYSDTHEGHCAVNAARVEFPDWRYE